MLVGSRIYAEALTAARNQAALAQVDLTNALGTLRQAVYDNWAKPIVTHLVNDTSTSHTYRSVLPPKPGSGMPRFTIRRTRR